MDLNEAKEFLLRIRQLGNIEKENSTSTIPTSEMKQWNDCLQKIIYSPELESMQDMINRWSIMDKKKK